MSDPTVIITNPFVWYAGAMLLGFVCVFLFVRK